MTKPTDDDLDTYPHVILTSDEDWDPTILDNEIDLTNIAQELDNLPPANVYGDIRFDPMGNYRGIYISQCKSSFLPSNGENSSFRLKSEDLEDFITACLTSVRRVYRLDWSSKPPDTSALRPYMCWQPPDVIEHTSRNTTHWGRHLPQSKYRKTYKSIFPTANVRRRNEAVATDSFLSRQPSTTVLSARRFLLV